MIEMLPDQTTKVEVPTNLWLSKFHSSHPKLTSIPCSLGFQAFHSIHLL